MTTVLMLRCNQPTGNIIALRLHWFVLLTTYSMLLMISWINSFLFHWIVFFAIKGALWYVAIATATFSSVKTTCYFYMSRYHIFLWKQTWYLVDGYIIINNIIIGRGWVVSGKQANIDPRDTDNKQLLDEAFVISGIIKVEVTIISWAKGRGWNTYQELDYSGYHKKQI